MKDGSHEPLLVGMVQSRRLQELREKALAARAAPVVNESPQTEAGKRQKGLSPELLLAREAIDKRLAEILATLPLGKQKRLFQIRFGIDLDRVKQLSIGNAVALLAIKEPDLLPSSPVMKRIAALNYDGEIADRIP